MTAGAIRRSFLLTWALTVLLSACGSAGDGFPFDPELTIPTNLTASPMNSSVILRWTETQEAVSYVIFYYSDPNFVQSKAVSDVPASVGGLENGVTYYFRVAAIDDENRMSGKSVLVQAVPDIRLGETETEGNDTTE